MYRDHDCFSIYTNSSIYWLDQFLLQFSQNNYLKIIKTLIATHPFRHHQMPPNCTKFSKFSRGRPPEPPYERGALPPFVLSPLLVPSALEQRLWRWLQHYKYPGYAPDWNLH